MISCYRSRTLVLMPPVLGRRVAPALKNESTSAAAPRPSLENRSYVIKALQVTRKKCSLDPPDDQGLPATTITGSKHSFDVSTEFLDSVEYVKFKNIN